MSLLFIFCFKPLYIYANILSNNTLNMPQTQVTNNLQILFIRYLILLNFTQKVSLMDKDNYNNISKSTFWLQ